MPRPYKPIHQRGRSTKTPLTSRLKTHMSDYILHKLRGYIATWPTSIPGVLIMINSISGILVCLFDPACGMDDIVKDWDKIVLALVGFGLLESRSINASSEEVRAIIVGLLASGLLFAPPAQAGVAMDDPLPIKLPDVPVENPNWLERGSIWSFAWADVGDGDNGAGVRLGYEVTDSIRIRFDYMVESFDFQEGQFADQSEATLSMRYEIAKGNHLFPYLIAGGGSASLATFEWEYLIGAGVDYEFSGALDGVTAFAEFLHIRTESAEFDDRNEVRIGIGVSLDRVGALIKDGPLPWRSK